MHRRRRCLFFRHYDQRVSGQLCTRRQPFRASRGMGDRHLQPTSARAGAMRRRQSNGRLWLGMGSWSIDGERLAASAWTSPWSKCFG